MKSTAIMQYLAEEYKKGDPIYPNEPKKRAIVNHRLAFNMASYYPSIGAYAVSPIFFDYLRTSAGLKKVNYVLSSFDKILEKQNSKFSAGDNLTIADFALVAATLSLEAIDFSFSDYKHVTKWYNTFKQECPELWSVAEEGMNVLKNFNINIPRFPHLDHPLNPVRK
uniref:GST C-terminal domain-containing protein n=1 Tax=Homalodisca liturata TaxID=320908 RepID=A0A1B6I8X6_9HEMI